MSEMTIIETAAWSRPTPMGHASMVELRRMVEATRERDQPGVYSISPAAAPTVEMREALGRRKALIDRWQAPAGMAASEGMIATVLGTMRSESAEEDATIFRRAYMLALSDLPLYAIEETCKAALQGKIGNPDFMPRSTQMHAYARRLLEPLRREREDILRVLNAKIETKPKLTPEERAARSAMVAEELRKTRENGAQVFAHERRGLAIATPARPAQDFRSEGQRKAEAQRRLDEMDYRGDTVELSDEARGKLER